MVIFQTALTEFRNQSEISASGSPNWKTCVKSSETRLGKMAIVSFQMKLESGSKAEKRCQSIPLRIRRENSLFFGPGNPSGSVRMIPFSIANYQTDVF